jgi:hypothetical protein
MKLSRIALAMAALSLPFAAAQANQSLVSPGYSSTIGGVSNEGTVHSSSFNPASNGILLKESERFRFGYLSNLGGYIEIGESDDLDKKVDNLVTDIEDAEDVAADGSGASQHLIDRYGNQDSQAAYFEAIAKEANDNLIPDLEKGGQFRSGFQTQAPLTPFLFRSNSTRGVFSLNASAQAQIGVGLLGDTLSTKTTLSTSGGENLGALNLDLEKVADAFSDVESILDDNTLTDQQRAEQLINVVKDSGLVEGNEETLKNLADEYGVDTSQYDFLSGASTASGASVSGAATGDLVSETDLVTNSGLDIRAAAIAHLGLGYGTRLSDWMQMNTEYGELELGARLNLYQAELARNFISLEAEANNASEDGENDTFENATDDFFENTEQSMGIGLDLGLLWHARNYQAGLTIYNVNEPEFDYPDLSEYLNADALNALQGLENGGKTQVAETVTLTRHAVLEGAFYSPSRNWMLQGSYTLGEATNFVGDEFQTMAVSAGYFPKAWWAPGLRAGYSQNLVGAELSKVHAGMTLFGILHLDAAVAMDTSSFDDSDVPRYASFSMGLEEKF